ncbi:hypothetical protein [Legionella gresilensis]|uniref:hypothetical protein n=1 Tax=Legionella gresilensis TaxID=91823 RepID=UPI0010410FBB|nr:hypothetical protein [Legionella gresilensis]
MDLELLALHEHGRNGMSVYLKPGGTSMMTPKLADEIRALQDSLAEKYFNLSFDIYFVIWYLQKNINFSCFSLDFRFVHDCLKQHKEKQMEDYIDKIFNLLFLNYIGLGLPIVNCSILTKYLSGFSKEFFLMNKICFIYQKKFKGFSKIKVFNEIENLAFTKCIYDKNHYYYYNPIQVSQMKSIIENTHYEIPKLLDINNAKLEFDALKKETLVQIYNVASKDIKVFSWLPCRDITGTVDKP